MHSGSYSRCKYFVCSINQRKYICKTGFLDNLHLYAPEFLSDEFNKYHKFLLNKIHRTKEEFYTLFEIFTSRIIFIPMEDIKQYLEKADQISPDPDD